MPKSTFPAAGSGLLETRRDMLRRTPAMMTAAATLPMVTLVPDPIFAALAEYKRLDEIFGNCCSADDEVDAENNGRVITEADRALVKNAFDASEEAFAKLLETVPTTLAGLKVLLETVLNESVIYNHIDIAMKTALRSPVFA